MDLYCILSDTMLIKIEIKYKQGGKIKENKRGKINKNEDKLENFKVSVTVYESAQLENIRREEKYLSRTFYSFEVEDKTKKENQ